MANDPYWDKVRMLIHADELADPNAASVSAAMTADFADWQEIGSGFVKGPSMIFYNNYLGVKGCHAFASGDVYGYIRFTAETTNLANTDFTIEAYVYLTDVPSADNTYRCIFQSWRTSSLAMTQDFGFILGRTSGVNNVQAKLRASAWNSVNFSFPLNQWVHIALVAQGTTGRMFVNGTLLLTFTIPAGPADAATNTIGLGYSTNVAPSVGINGFVRDVRFTSVAKYTAAFTPANPLPYPYPVRDAKGGRRFTAIGSALTPYTADYKYGGGCMRFDGASYLTSSVAASGADWNFGTGDCTIEAFVKVEAAPASGLYGQIFGIWAWAYDNGWCFGIDSTLKPAFWYRTTTTDYHLVPASSISLNTWYHFAVSRQGPNLYFFIDGAVVASRSDVAGLTLGNSTVPIFFGRRSNTAGDWFTGLIDEVRVTKGAARYTAPFTPPTQQHPEAITVVSGTVRDAAGVLCSRLVRVYSRANGRMLGESWSDPVAGTFSIGAAEECYAVVIDNTGSYNSLILDRLDPLTS